MTIDDLREYGMVPMDDEAIRGFLSAQNVGVLALPTDGAPSMRPMSFVFDGGSRLNFVYVLGSGSRKDELSTRADTARFLVYSAETAYNWRSVLLTGTITEVPEREWEEVRGAGKPAWRPEVFERAEESEDVRFYAFEIEEQTGIEHLGLPDGFEGSARE